MPSSWIGKKEDPDSMIDAFGILDGWMYEKASLRIERPASLLLTGDQIYADDVAMPTLTPLRMSPRMFLAIGS